MTRFSETLLPTLRDPPAEAEALSHKLMVRAGLIRQLATGLWTYLPAGWRVLRRVEGILREEMEAIGCQEMLMPVLQPAEPWQKTGRYEIEEMFKLKDRRGSELVLAMTHEECITHHIATEVRSYRELPLMLFQIQTKERDEPRPRAGVLRTREFTMKDAYSFDRDIGGLEHSYQLQTDAYARILDRCGLLWHRVEADVGMMGGLGAHEYMAPCPAGEDAVALAPDFAANVEVTTLRAGDPGPHGGSVEVQTAIEVGNIFKLGTRYSKPLGATYLDEHGHEQPIVMGSYGSDRRGSSPPLSSSVPMSGGSSGRRQSRPGRCTSFRSPSAARPSGRSPIASTVSCRTSSEPRCSMTIVMPAPGRS